MILHLKIFFIVIPSSPVPGAFLMKKFLRLNLFRRTRGIPGPDSITFLYHPLYIPPLLN